MKLLGRKSRSARLGQSLGHRCGVPIGVGMAAAVLLGAKPDEASAAALGGGATSFGLLAVISILWLVKAWNAHGLAGSFSTLGGLLALAAGAVLIWRYSATPRGRQLAASGPVAVGANGAVPPTGDGQIPLPAGVDRHRLLVELRQSFLALQTAWDHGARDQLGQMTTPDMLQELCAARSVGYGISQRSEVLTLDVRLIAFEEIEAAQIVCVEFSGLIRESLGSAAGPFRELWMLTRKADEADSWRLARHQAIL